MAVFRLPVHGMALSQWHKAIPLSAGAPFLSSVNTHFFFQLFSLESGMARFQMGPYPNS